MVTRHEAVIEASLDGIIALDSSCKVIEFNPAAERMLGHARADVIGRDAVDLLAVADRRENARRVLANCLADCDAELLGRHIETAAIRVNGHELPVEMSLTRVQDSPDDAPVLYAFLRDISERRRSQEQLTYLAYHDPLTGLPNRSQIERHLEMALARAERNGHAVALMFADLDDFKLVNDRLGHAAGDRLLAEVADRLRGNLRATDVLGRHGGDEFLVLLTDVPGDPIAKAETVASNLLGALREPFVIGTSEVKIGGSVGISVYPEDATDTEALLRHADVAMYAAKSHGGGRYAFHQHSNTVRARQASLPSQLRRALAEDEFVLHYQPVWNLAVNGGGIAGLEALIRWQHPELGLLMPGSFIDAAEESSMGDELADWVARAVCRQASEWCAAGLRPHVSLNVSPHQLRATDFAHRLLGQIAAHRLDPTNFVVELTESAWTIDALGTLSAIETLRSAGVRLAIDDFGAGWSSLRAAATAPLRRAQGRPRAASRRPLRPDCGRRDASRAGPGAGMRLVVRGGGCRDRGAAAVSGVLRRAARSGLPPGAAPAGGRGHGPARAVPRGGTARHAGHVARGCGLGSRRDRVARRWPAQALPADALQASW